MHKTTSFPGSLILPPPGALTERDPRNKVVHKIRGQNTDLLSPSAGVSCPVICVTCCCDEFSIPPPDCLGLKQHNKRKLLKDENQNSQVWNEPFPSYISVGRNLIYISVQLLEPAHWVFIERRVKPNKRSS